MGSTEFPMAVMGFIGFYRVLPSFIGFYLVTGRWWTKLERTHKECSTSFKVKLS